MNATATESAYAAAERWLERRPRLGISAGLERTRALLEALGRPDLGLRGVLIAGTNGKGSVAAMTDAAVRAAGVRTALLSKPHLVEWRERICIDGAPVAQDEFVDLLDVVMAAVRHMDLSAGAPSRIEILTAMGVVAARRGRVDAVICEVGVGGRLDSTNVLDLGLSAITRIGLDHRALLGDTVEQIAAEKAAIIRPGGTVITSCGAQALPVIRRRCEAIGATVVVVGDRSCGADQLPPDVVVPLAGPHQRENAACAWAVARRLVPQAAPRVLAGGLARARHRGRLEWIDGVPRLLLDAAHNPQAMAALVRSLGELQSVGPLGVVFGVMADKDVDAMLPQLRSITAAPVMVTVSDPRALPAAELCRRFGPGAVPAQDLEQALRRGARGAGAVLVCGSLRLVGDVLRLVEPSAPR